MTLEFKGVPPSLNQFAGRKNEWKYRAAKQEWTQAVWFKGLSMRPAKPYAYALIEITYRFPDKRRRDPDNYCGKFLLDGLTKAGIIEDDSFSHIRLSVGAEREVGPARTIIKITEVSDE